ncbi:hypothetical protein ACLB2K_033119 [Fragaria x ananassa]
MSYSRRDLLGSTSSAVESSRINPAGVSSQNGKQRQYLTCSRRIINAAECGTGGAESDRRKQAEAEESLHKVIMFRNFIVENRNEVNNWPLCVWNSINS